MSDPILAVQHDRLASSQAIEEQPTAVAAAKAPGEPTDLTTMLIAIAISAVLGAMGGKLLVQEEVAAIGHSSSGLKVLDVTAFTPEQIGVAEEKFVPALISYSEALTEQGTIVLLPDYVFRAPQSARIRPEEVKAFLATSGMRKEAK